MIPGGKTGASMIKSMWLQTDIPQSTEMMCWECPLLCARGRVSGVGVGAGVSGAFGVSGLLSRLHSSAGKPSLIVVFNLLPDEW